MLEDLGYDLISCGEHVLFNVPSSNALVPLATILERTAVAPIDAGGPPECTLGEKS